MSAVVVLAVFGGIALLANRSSVPGPPATAPQPSPAATTAVPETPSTAPATVGQVDDPIVPDDRVGVEDALEQVAAFHSVWNAASVDAVIAQFQPESARRADVDLITIALEGFHATVTAECSAGSSSDPATVAVTCLETVEDDFYTSVGIRLSTQVTYSVTPEGLDVLYGQPIWAISPRGTALDLLEDFDAEVMNMDLRTIIPGWISLDPAAEPPNWGEDTPRAYSVETVRDAELAIGFLTSEFVYREGDPWEPQPFEQPKTVPAPQSQVSACPMPTRIPDESPVEPWLVDLHRAVGLLVQHTNALGVAVTEVEDFTAGWQDREPVAGAVADVIADLDAIEAIGAESGVDAELFEGISHYRDSVLPAFFGMRSQGTAIAYFNEGGETQGPCGAAAGAVLTLEWMLGLAQSE